MKIIVVDLELNQPSRKFIQIGAICMNLRTGEGLSEFNQYINPEEELSQFIVDLTGITQKQVDNGFKIQDSLTEFWHWVQSKGCKNIHAWGHDVWEIINESKKNGVSYPNVRSYNIKEFATIVKVALPNSAQSGGLNKTMNTFGLKFEGKQHNALDDAKNTAQLLFYLKEQFRQIFEIKRIAK